MMWGHPKILLALWLVPLLVWLAWRVERERRGAARRFADDPMRQRLFPPGQVGRHWTKSLLAILGIACLILAAARPRFGEYLEQVAQHGLDVFVVLDVSRSMLAEDVVPNRLERAKLDVKDLLERLPRDRVGLIAFAGKPVVRVPLTNDFDFFRMMLDETTPETAPLGGSLIGDALRRAIAAFEDRPDRDRVLVLITDGEDQESAPLEAAQDAAARGIRIVAVGLGDAVEGARIPRDDADGFVRHQGREVWSKMNETLLRDLAEITQGVYVPAGTRAFDLGQIVESHLAGMSRGELPAPMRRRFHEQFQWFLAAGWVLLFLEAAFPSARPRVPGSVEEVVP